MDLKLNLHQKLLAIGALVLALVLAAFVFNSYKSQSKSVINPAPATGTPDAANAVSPEAFPQGTAPDQNALNPVNDTSVTGAGVNPVGNAPASAAAPVYTNTNMFYPAGLN